MSEIVRAALVQSSWTGDKQSMIEANIEFAREAAAQGAQVLCFQELFYGPYFCQVQDSQYFSFTEAVPGGPTTELMCSLARELRMVLVVPVFEEEQPGVYYNTASSSTPTARTSGSTARPISPRSKVSGKSTISAPATSATRSSRPPLARSGSTSATTATSPKAGERSGSPGHDRIQPLGHQPQPVPVPVAPRTAGGRRGQRVLHRRYQPGRRRAAG